jgi:DNA sulfur modification protein DndE
MRVLAAAMLAMALAAPAAAETIFIASDSTAQTYKAERYPQTGWGQMLPCALDPDVRVENRAMGGRSTRTFIGEGRWDRLMADLKPGDTVLIQFGHNDASRNKPERFVEAATGYRDNLLRFVWQVRGAGGIPVLITPVARRSFDESGRAKADFASYSAVVREVASATDTRLIDLEALSRAWIDRVGKTGSEPYFLHYPKGKYAAFKDGIADDTHFSEVGARGVADLVAQGLRNLDLPVSSKVHPGRPELTRTTPLGSVACR